MVGLKVAELFAALSLRPDTKSFDSADRLLSGLRHGLEAFVSVEALRGLADLTEQTVELGEHLHGLAQTAGVPVEALQALGYAAKLNGSDLDSMADGLRFLSKNMFTAAHGGKEQAKIFREMGVAVTDAHGRLRPAEDVLGDISDHFASMPDGAEKTALAMKVLGRAGAGLIPTLNSGSKGLAAMGQEARDLGGVMSAEDVEALKALDNNLDRVKFTLTGVKNQLVIALLPAIQELVTGLLTWVKANRELISSGIHLFVRGLVFALQTVGKAFSLIARGVEYLAGHRAVLYAILGALALMFGPGMLAAVATWAAGIVVAFAPFLLIGGAIAAAIYGLEQLFSALSSGETLGEVWDQIVEGMKHAWQDFTEWAQGVYQKMLDGLEVAGQKFVDYVKGQASAGENDPNYASDASYFDRVLHPIKTVGSVRGNRAAHQRDVDAAEQARQEAEQARLESLAGGGWSGGAMAPARGGGSQTLNANVTINLPAGSDPAAVGAAVRRAIQEHTDSIHRDALSATGGKGHL